MRNLLRVAILGAIAAAASLFIPSARAITDIPPVIVRGVATDGGQIICRGAGCAELVMFMSTPPFFTWDDTIEQDSPIDRTKFCQSLKAKKPAYCPATPPSTNPPKLSRLVLASSVFASSACEVWGPLCAASTRSLDADRYVEPPIVASRGAGFQPSSRATTRAVRV